MGCTSTQNITHSLLYGVRCVKPPLKKIYYTISKERYKIFVLYERSLIETVPFFSCDDIFSGRNSR